jgi:hypothetical protein
MARYTAILAGALCAAPGALHAQFDFHVDGRDVQVHSFAQQGFAYSSANNSALWATGSRSSIGPDVQDVDVLFRWALLPQSVYSPDQ